MSEIFFGYNKGLKSFKIQLEPSNQPDDFVHLICISKGTLKQKNSSLYNALQSNLTKKYILQNYHTSQSTSLLNTFIKI